MNVTVRDFLRQNPNADLDVMTPKGFVRIPSGYGPWLLSDKSKNAVFKTNGSKDIILAAELMDQVIFRVVPYKNTCGRVFLLTNSLSGSAKSPYRPQIEYEQMAFDLRRRNQ